LLLNFFNQNIFKGNMMNSSNQLYKKIAICFLVALFAVVITVIVMNPSPKPVEGCDMPDVMDIPGNNWSLDVKVKYNDIEKAMLDKRSDGKDRCRVRIEDLPKIPMQNLSKKYSQASGSASIEAGDRCCINLGGWLLCGSKGFCDSPQP
jgi:hypothetical protein